MGNAAGCSNKKATELAANEAYKTTRTLEDQRLNLDKNEKFLMKRIMDEENNIERCMSVGNEQGARYALKRIGQYQEELNAVRSQQNTIMSQIDSVREATGQIEQFNATTSGITQLDKQQKLLNPDKINDVNVQMNNQFHNRKNIRNALSKEVGDPGPDRDDLYKYLANKRNRYPPHPNNSNYYHA